MLEKNLDLTRHPCTNTQALTIQSAHRSPSHNRICKIWNIKWKKKRFPTLLSILLSFSIYPSSRRLVNSMKKKKKKDIEYRSNSFPTLLFFLLSRPHIFVRSVFSREISNWKLSRGWWFHVIFLLFRTLLTLQRGISSIENRKRI